MRDYTQKHDFLADMFDFDSETSEFSRNWNNMALPVTGIRKTNTQILMVIS